MKNKKLKLFSLILVLSSFSFITFEKNVKAETNVPVYRMYNSNSGEHFYTENLYEARSLHDKSGWNYEGIQSYQPTSGIPVFRLYNKNAGVHFYTLDTNERDHLKGLGWRYECVSFMSGGNIPIYRSYNPNNSQHNYTTHAYEQNHLTSIGWRGEGTAFKAAAVGNPTDNTINRQPVWHDNTICQDDRRWGGIWIGNGNLASEGCGPTSISMVLNGFGGKYTPVQIANTARAIGTYNRPGAPGDGIDGVTLVNTLHYYGMNTTHITSQQQLINELRAGKPVIFGMEWLFSYPGISHFVVLHGYSNGNTVINDPLHRVSGWNSVNRIWTHPSRLSDDLNAGFPAWSSLPK